MKTKIFLNLSLVIIIFFGGCTKKPNASFEFNKKSYIAGDTVIIKNSSTLGTTYRWTFSTGVTSTNKDSIQFVLPYNISDGTLTVKLEAFSKNRKLVDEVEQTVETISKKVKVMFWCSRGNQQNENKSPITVYLNFHNAFINDFRYNDNMLPSYESIGVATFYELPVGKYGYSAFQDAIPGTSVTTGQPPVTIIIPGVPPNSWHGIVDVNSDKIIRLQ
jgi:hypothetical protein